MKLPGRGSGAKPFRVMDRSVLQGVSRGTVFDLAKELGIPVSEEDLQPYDLYTADEAFFTSTSPCVLPVTKVDRRPIGDGKPGPAARSLLDLLEQDMRTGARLFAIPYD